MNSSTRRIRALRPSQRGFTLLEILIVILIIGVMTAGLLLSLSFTGKDTQLKTESKRLLSLMDYAREQAELQTRDYGIFFGEHGYEFVVYDVRTGAWRPVDEDDALRERTLPSGLEFKLVVDARPIVLSANMEVPPQPKSDSTASSQPHPMPSVPRSADANSDSSSSSDSDSNADSDSGSDAGKSFAPQVMIFASGDLSSFSITVQRPTAGRSITLDENQDGDIVEKKMVVAGGT